MKKNVCFLFVAFLATMGFSEISFSQTKVDSLRVIWKLERISSPASVNPAPALDTVKAIKDGSNNIIGYTYNRAATGTPGITAFDENLSNLLITGSATTATTPGIDTYSLGRMGSTTVIADANINVVTIAANSIPSSNSGSTLTPAQSISDVHYAEFKIQNLKDSTIVDSLKFLAYGASTSGTRLLVKYSLDNFATAGLQMPTEAKYVNNGTTLAVNSADAFSTAISVVSHNATPTIPEDLVTIKFGLNKIKLTGSQTLSVRLYPYATAGSTTKNMCLTNVAFLLRTYKTTALPLDFLSFTGKSTGLGKTVDLNWTTTNEVNTKNFEIQKIYGPTNFKTIGTVVSKNTLGINRYSFVDVNASEGTSYYRIVQFDNDGASKSSDVIAVTSKPALSFSVYPNPVNQTLNVNYAVAEKGSVLQVLNLDGKTIIQKNINNATTTASLDVSQLVSGSYIIRLKSQDQNVSKEFIKR